MRTAESCGPRAHVVWRNAENAAGAAISKGMTGAHVSGTRLSSFTGRRPEQDTMLERGLKTAFTLRRLRGGPTRPFFDGFAASFRAGMP